MLGEKDGSGKQGPRMIAVAGLAILLFLAGNGIGKGEFADASATGGELVTLVIINRLSLENLMDRPSSCLQNLASRGAIGLMNTRTGGGLTAENAYTTLGGGLRLVGGAEAKIALPAQAEHGGELVRDVYRRRTGWEAAPGALVVLDIENIKANNLASLGVDRVGTIGEALGRKGKAAAVIGNADYDGEYQRWAALIAMDARGQVPVGHVGSDLYRVDPAFPTGYRANLEALGDAYLAARSLAQFIVVDLGDMDRVEAERKQLRPSRYQNYRQEAMDGADALLEQILQAVDLAREWVLVVSPLPASHEIAQGRLLTPIIAAGPRIAPGLLTSQTTRRPGVVTNYDIAPTVLTWLEMGRPPGLPGALLTSTGGIPGRYSYLQDLLRRSAGTYQQRSPLLKAFVSLEIIVYLTVFGLVVVFPSLPRDWTGFLSFTLLFIAATPLALLLLPLLQPVTVPVAFLYALALAVLITGFTQRWVKSTENRYAIICGVTAFALAIDTCVGGPLIRFSPLGYDVMLGARFYGIGNEYMGILIGSSLVAALAARERWPQASAIALIWFLIVTLLLAAPGLGANAGGTITALIAFPLAWGLVSREKWLRTIIVGGIVFMAVLGLNVLPVAGVGSHVGRALKTAMEGNWLVILQIIQRKMSMNWKLMRYSIWSKGLLVALGVMALLVYRPTPVVQAVMEEHPTARSIVFSTIVASIVALVFNDSGVVAGGTTSVYAAGLILSLILEQRAELKKQC